MMVAGTFKTQVSFCLAVLILLPCTVFAETGRLNLNDTFPVIEAESRIWIGTPGGLNQFNSDDETFKRFSLPVEGEGIGVRRLHHSDEWLWCVLDSGLAALHLRLNEWLYFDAASGLPSDIVNGLGFDDEYVWVATAGGAARFDLLIEEWEVFDEARGIPERSVNDVLAREDKIWFVTDHWFSEYDPEFEKWRHYRAEEDTTALLSKAFFLGEELWIVSDRGLIRFNTELRTRQTFFEPHLTPVSLRELLIEDDTIWAVTGLGIYLYDQASGVWREFEGNAYLAASAPVDAYIDGSEIWVLTGQNVLVWDRTDKDWELLDYASGLSTSVFDGVHASGGMVFLLAERGIDYRMSAESNWRRHDIGDAGAAPGGRGRNILAGLFDNEEGGSVELGKYRWTLEGSRITLISDYERELGAAEGDGEIETSERLDVKSQLALGESRSVSGFYNNVDYSETMYGVRYRSREDDLLREYNWGDIRHEPGSIPFAETASLFGSNIWLQTGPKTPRFKRSLITVKAETGERRSKKTYEHLRGASEQFEVTTSDVGYTRNQFYAIEGLVSIDGIEDLKVYIDDLNPSSNTPNTLERENVAGIVGDFDLMKAPEDYYLYGRGGVIRFTSYVGSSWSVVIRASVDGTVYEEVLQHDGVISTARTNFYYLNAQHIIPYSFGLTIRDSLGVAVPLDEFGIDENADSSVDSEWIDYVSGILFFPETEPFPPAVYDPDAPKSSYRIEACFETELALIQLAHTDLVRGTETLWLDGVPAEGGNDYVLDYTNGTLVFVREGVVDADTRIEIEYEYHVVQDTREVSGAMLNYSPLDNFYVQGDWIRVDGNEDPHLVSLHGEVRQSVGGFDVRLIPGFAYNPEGYGFAASHLEGLVSSSRFRFQAKYRGYAEDYSSLYHPQSVLGDVRSDLRLSATADVTDDLRLTGGWNDVEGFRAMSAISRAPASSEEDRSADITLLLHRGNWPAWELTYRDFRTRSHTGDSDKYFIQSRVEYQVPGSWARKALLDALRTEIFVRTGEQSGLAVLGAEEQSFRQGYVRLNANMSDQFQAGLFYRRNDLKDISTGGDDSPVSRLERSLVSLSHEEWRVVQVNLRMENTLDQYFHRSSSTKDAGLNQYSQVNLRMSPGQIWDRLSPLYFEFDVNQSLYGKGTTRNSVGNWVWEFFRPNHGSLENSQVTRNWYLKNELRPGSRWYVHSLLEWNDEETNSGLSSLESRYRRWSERVDVKLGLKTRLNLLYEQYHQDLGYARTDRYYKPSAWIEHRWTPDLQNTFNVLFKRDRSDEGVIEDISDTWEGRYVVIWRKNRFLGIRRLELRQTFSGSRSRTTGYNEERTYQLTSTSSLDLYPLHSMVLRFQSDFNRHIDELAPENDYDTIALNLKVSLRF